VRVDLVQCYHLCAMATSKKQYSVRLSEEAEKKLAHLHKDRGVVPYRFIREAVEAALAGVEVPPPPPTVIRQKTFLEILEEAKRSV